MCLDSCLSVSGNEALLSLRAGRRASHNVGAKEAFDAMSNAKRITNVEESAANTETRKSITMLVGYGWQKIFENVADGSNDVEVLHDSLWQSLKEMFRPSYECFRKRNVIVDFNRLRASHGRPIWESITKKIDMADLLIFDVAAAPRVILPKDVKSDFSSIVQELNSNVLLELGYALGRGKQVMLMCPEHLFDKVPSDLKGYLWTTYTYSVDKDGLKRRFRDTYGALNAFRGILREIASEKLLVNCEED